MMKLCIYKQGEPFIKLGLRSKELDDVVSEGHYVKGYIIHKPYKISIWEPRPGAQVIKIFSCSTRLSMKFILLIIFLKMPTIIGILTFISRINKWIW